MPKSSASLTLSLYPRTGATLPPNGGGSKRDAQTERFAYPLPNPPPKWGREQT
jgi:hypothetical protein